MRIRPETFIKKGVVKNYFDQLKTSQSQNAHSRYGKRFSESKSTKVQQQFTPEKWQDIYEIIKHYEENQPSYYY
ncbi:hypothetical protein RN001_002291 [Aquatica leii]|uniref:Uncharacterized protein n=1 Tax=Aquatica leii TaxID=1421715 RepID=A0AAN7SST4_9COLE|nr:hypothetical protein RN001_002291 [Aquatica leii]